jgi:nucleolar GTP-binding protein
MDIAEILDRLKSLRMKTSVISKDYASKISQAETALDCKNLFEEGVEQLKLLYTDSLTNPASIGMKELGEIHKKLRKVPVIQQDLPTIVLVGAPNVGKSSIVRKISSGTPEVNDYPFTTRGVTMGHIFDHKSGERYQVMDTPGLLDRPESERNEMEKLTFASLAHLPTGVIFVIDPTGLSGDKTSSLTAQLAVRSYLKQRFPRRPWIDVLSKGDIPITETIEKELKNAGVEKYLRVSTVSDMNLEILKNNVNNMLLTLNDFLHVMQGSGKSP